MATDPATLEILIRARDQAAATLGRLQKQVDTFGTRGSKQFNRVQMASAAAAGPRGIGGIGPALGGIQRFLGPLGLATIGIGALTFAVGDSINAAKTLNESYNAVNVVFRESADTVVRATANVEQYGLAQADSNRLLTRTGALLTNFGFHQQEAADQSLVLLQRASDLASVFDTEVEDALTAVNAALRGEGEAIEAYGASVSVATLRQFGYNETLSEAEKVQIRLRAILEQTNAVQGDFAKTSGSAANQTRILAAEVETLQAQLGGLLIPALEQGQGQLIVLTRQAQDLGNELTILAFAIDEATSSSDGFEQSTEQSGLRIQALEDALDFIRQPFDDLEERYIANKNAQDALNQEIAIAQGAYRDADIVIQQYDGSLFGAINTLDELRLATNKATEATTALAAEQARVRALRVQFSRFTTELPDAITATDNLAVNANVLGNEFGTLGVTAEETAANFRIAAEAATESAAAAEEVSKAVRGVGRSTRELSGPTEAQIAFADEYGARWGAAYREVERAQGRVNRLRSGEATEARRLNAALAHRSRLERELSGRLAPLTDQERHLRFQLNNLDIAEQRDALARNEFRTGRGRLAGELNLIRLQQDRIRIESEGLFEMASNEIAAAREQLAVAQQQAATELQFAKDKLVLVETEIEKAILINEIKDEGEKATLSNVQSELRIVENILSTRRRIAALAVGTPAGGATVQVPAFQRGGIVRSPTLGLIGEAGPEAVIPLNRAGALGNITIINRGTIVSQRDFDEMVITAFNRAERNGRFA